MEDRNTVFRMDWEGILCSSGSWMGLFQKARRAYFHTEHLRIVHGMARMVPQGREFFFRVLNAPLFAERRISFKTWSFADTQLA